MFGALNQTTDVAAATHVIDNKGSLIAKLLYPVGDRKRHNGYHKKLTLQADRGNFKYKLRGTTCTNGLVLNLLAYDTGTTKRIVQRPMSQASTDDGDDEELFAGAEDDFDLDHAFNAESEAIEVETSTSTSRSSTSRSSTSRTSTSRASTSRTPTSRTPTSRSSSSRQPIEDLIGASDPDSDSDLDEDYTEEDLKSITDAYNPINDINWERGSRLLENVQKVFNTRQACAGYQNARVVGIDPGEKNTMTATVIDPLIPVARKSVIVRRKFLYRPYAIFRRLLEEKKHASGIDTLESLMPSMALFGMAKYLSYLSTEKRREQLYAFYSDKWFLKKTWDCRKAQQASYDYGIKAILGLVHGSEGHRRPTQNPDGTRTRNSVFAIGLGSFNTRTGLPSKHTEFEKRFVKRVSNEQSNIISLSQHHRRKKTLRR